MTGILAAGSHRPVWIFVQVPLTFFLRVLCLEMFPLSDASSCSPLPSSGSCGIAAHSSPFSSVLPVRTPPPPPSRFVSGLPRLALLASHFLLARKAEVFPKFLGNPSEHVPRARDSGGSSGPRSIGPADAAFRLANGVGFHNHKRFRSWFPHGPCSRCLRFAPIRSPG